MPKVLPEHLQRRREQIIDAACACFAREGFHRTTMHDICEEADLSPGAVYRYFPSKEDLIRSIGDDSCQRQLDLIESIRGIDDMRQALATLAAQSFARVAGIEGSIDIDLWAEAMRSPAIKESLNRGSKELRDSFMGLVRDGQARGDLNPDLDPEAVARVFISLFQGLVLQKELEGAVDVPKSTAVVMALAVGDLWRDRRGEQRVSDSH